MARALAATVTALAAAAALVAAGAASRLDAWGVDHVMPGLDPLAQDHGVVDPTGLWRPFPLAASWWEKLLDAGKYPASALVSAAVVALVCLRLSRRAALVWAGAWCALNAAEVAGKRLLERPAVHWSNAAAPVHVTPFDHSFPSGHAARAVLLAGLVAFVWPGLRSAAAAWAALVPAALVAARTIIRAWTPSTSSSRGSSTASSATPSPSWRTSRASGSRSPTPS